MSRQAALYPSRMGPVRLWINMFQILCLLEKIHWKDPSLMLRHEGRPWKKPVRMLGGSEFTLLIHHAAIRSVFQVLPVGGDKPIWVDGWMDRWIESLNLSVNLFEMCAYTLTKTNIISFSLINDNNMMSVSHYYTVIIHFKTRLAQWQ